MPLSRCINNQYGTQVAEQVIEIPDNVSGEGIELKPPMSGAVTWTKISGDPNLLIIDGKVVPTNPIPDGVTQTILVRAESGDIATEFPVAITGKTPPPKPFFNVLPAISGGDQIGDLLTATQGEITVGRFTTGQWYRGAALIAGATGLTYRTVLADNNQTITYRQTALSAGGTTIEASNAITIATPLPSFDPVALISGNPEVGEVLTAVPGTVVHGTVTVGQWYRNTAAIAGATGLTYTVVAADNNRTLTYRETATNAAGSFVGISNSLQVVTEPPVFTSSPVIAGDNVIGSVLTCTPGTVTGGQITARQWLRNGSTIGGATGLTYTLQAADDGRAITVRESSTNLGGTVTSTSNAISVVAPLPVTTNAPSISGTGKIGSPLSRSAGSYQYGTVTSRKWYRDGVEIAGATNPSYIPTIDDDLKTITYREIVTGTGGTITGSASNGIAITAVVPVFTTAPQLTGSGNVGLAITATDGVISAGATITKSEWLLNGVVIAGATTASYTAVSGDIGKTITYRQTASSSGGTTTSTSNAISISAAAPTFTKAPVISGEPYVGFPLTLTPGEVTNGTITSTQWYWNGNAIAGETGLTYTPSSSANTRTITVKQIATNQNGTTESTSNAIVVTTTTPVWVRQPSITGDNLIGSTLTADVGEVYGATSANGAWYRGSSAISGTTNNLTYKLVSADDGQDITYRVNAASTAGSVYGISNAISAMQGEPVQTTAPSISGTGKAGVGIVRTAGVYTSGSVTAREWLADGVPISGATGTSYAPPAASDGKKITYRETVTSTGGSIVSDESNAITVTLNAPTFTSVPTITGTAVVGNTLTGGNGTLSANVNYAGTITGRQWLRDGVAIAGATNTTYVVVAADNGKNISYQQTATNSGGSTTSVSTVRLAAAAKPVFTALPTASGVGVVGNTLTGVDGTVDVGSVTSRQWYRDGAAISGATALTYRLVTADEDKSITFRNTATNAAGTTDAFSTAIAVDTPAPTVTTKPSWNGTPRVSYGLTSVPGVYTNGTVASRRWLLDGVQGSNSASYTLPETADGKTISYEETVTGAGGTIVVTSDKTAVATFSPPIFSKPPVISGTGEVGQTLTAVDAGWYTANQYKATLKSQTWLRDGVPISGATNSTYVLTSEDAGKSITFRQTITNSGGDADSTSNAISVAAV